MLTVTTALAAGAAMLPVNAFAATPHTGTVTMQPSKRGSGGHDTGGRGPTRTHHPAGSGTTGSHHPAGSGAGCGSCDAPTGGTPSGVFEPGGTAGGGS